MMNICSNMANTNNNIIIITNNTMNTNKKILIPQLFVIDQDENYQ
jgi:hypothetical protein